MLPSEGAIEIYINYLRLVLMFSTMARNRALGETFCPPVAGVRTVTESERACRPQGWHALPLYVFTRALHKRSADVEIKLVLGLKIKR
jgi:hypothetical protein